MAGAQIEASLRRASLLAQARGFVVPDSRPVLDPSPQIIIEGEDEDIFLDFTDGLGYTTDKSAYKNYGFKFIWVHNNKVRNSASSQAITEDLDTALPNDIPIFNPTTAKYEPKPLAEKAVELGIAKAESKEFGSVLFLKPENKTYKIARIIPYNIQILAANYQVTTGSVSGVTLPSGNYNAGQDISVAFSGASPDAEVVITFSYKRDLNA